jgi:general secretion pathway protein L
MYSLGGVVAAQREEDVLILDVGIHGFSLALCSSGKVQFIRRLPYPDQMYTLIPFRFDANGLRIVNYREAEDCIASLCRSVLTSLEYFHLETGISFSVEEVLLSGLVAEREGLKAMVQEGLAMKTNMLELTDGNRLRVGVEVGKKWKPWLYNRALALALGGVAKKHVLNLRQGEFASRNRFLQTEKMLPAAALVTLLLFGGIIGYLWFSAGALQKVYDQNKSKINAVYYEVFPGAKNVRDAYTQMKVALRDVQGPGANQTVYTREKRSLAILADISQRIPDSVSIHVNRLVIDQEAVRIKGTTDAFNNVDVIKNKLSASSRYQDVDILSATKDRDKGIVRFEVRLLLEEQS